LMDANDRECYRNRKNQNIRQFHVPVKIAIIFFDELIAFRRAFFTLLPRFLLQVLEFRSRLDLAWQ